MPNPPELQLPNAGETAAAQVPHCQGNECSSFEPMVELVGDFNPSQKY